MCSIQRYYDYVVVGAGAMGISTALYLVEKYPSAKCALVEQFQLGHNQGSSHSEIRIIRSTYHHPFYRDLCLQAMAKNWPFVQKLLGDQFIVQNPFLAFVQEQHPEYKNYKEVAVTSHNIKEMSIQQMRKMYPYAPNVTSTKTVFVQQTSGIVLAQQYQRKAVQYLLKCPTLDIYQKTEVLQIMNDETGVYLTIRNRNHKDVYVLRAKKATLSCGRWIGKVVPEMQKIVKPVKQTVSYWKLKNEKACTLGQYPSWVYIHKNEYHYSLPDATGDGLKFALHNQDPEHEKKFSNEKQLEKADLKQLKKLMEQLYKDQVVSLSKVQSCYYSVTKTQDFIIDWSDEHQNVLICSPCSGHGFKFSPIIGEIVADLLKKDESIQIYEKYRYLTRVFYHLGVNLQ